MGNAVMAMPTLDPPAPAAGFQWVLAPWGVQLVADALAAFRHGWTTRQLQLRGAPHVEADGWRQLASWLGVEPELLVRLRQVHGSQVFFADHHLPLPGPPDADAATSGDPSRALTVQVADCVPLLMAHGSSGHVGVAHAGWRGTAAGIALAASSALGDGAGQVAAIGPSIGPCCYEVGAELRDRFRDGGWARGADDWFEQRAGRWYLDLWRANVDQLVAAGVPARAIHVSRLCTSCHPDWFPSYRRDGAGAGRLAGVIRAAGER
jgi:polyphenol oxidase